jgi:GTP1/Obg family GTP-binding protein
LRTLAERLENSQPVGLKQTARPAHGRINIQERRGNDIEFLEQKDKPIHDLPPMNPEIIGEWRRIFKLINAVL